MKANNFIKAFCVIFLALTFTGCIGVNRSFKMIRQNLTESLDVRYEKQFEFSVGSAGLMLAGMIVKLSDVEEPVDEILSRVSLLQIGVYEKSRYGDLHATYEDLVSLTELMEMQGWEYLVRTVDDDEMAAVFVEKDCEEFNRIYVIAIEQDEMVLVEVHGDLAEIIEIAIREKGLHFEVANN
ncbi:MAG: DUF4252 domain-containing protein [Melioribacteraceae bacterium]|nr:DUF4252 domain-containing protein [Melioribacteraceae bacterium]